MLNLVGGLVCFTAVVFCSRDLLRLLVVDCYLSVAYAELVPDSQRY